MLALHSRRSLARSIAGAVLAVALAGCASAPQFDAAPTASIELVDVPFFPQTAYQCGPAALATILAHEGLNVGADELAPAVYVEGLRGSLQAELLAATRRHGLVPYLLEPNPAALFAEVESGRPVLVLQNVGLRRFPVWHYAVVVGFDADRGAVVLRSGTERRRRERLARFLRSWRRGEQWAFVAAPADNPPATATAERWIRAVADTERMLPRDTAADAFAVARTRWPHDALVLFAAAAHKGAAGRWEAAARDYTALLELDPGHAAARNNLANMLAEGGCFDEALRHAHTALAAVAPDSSLYAPIRDTVETLARQAGGIEPAHCRGQSPFSERGVRALFPLLPSQEERLPRKKGSDPSLHSKGSDPYSLQRSASCPPAQRHVPTGPLRAA
jgi:tetratricopeptide (TPR) repeat protein